MGIPERVKAFQDERGFVLDKTGWKRVSDFSLRGDLKNKRLVVGTLRSISHSDAEVFVCVAASPSFVVDGEKLFLVGDCK